MTLERSILVMTSLAGNFDEWAELAAALKAHVGAETARFRLIVPASPGVGGREVALRHLRGAIAGLADAGLTADGCVGDSDPMIAVQEAWDPSVYDEIIISSLPTGLSKWLHAAFPERVVKLTAAPVTHHVWEPTKPRLEAESGTLADHQPLLPRSPLVPLAVLQWGRRPSPSHDPWRVTRDACRRQASSDLEAISEPPGAGHLRDGGLAPAAPGGVLRGRDRRSRLCPGCCLAATGAAAAWRGAAAHAGCLPGSRNRTPASTKRTASSITADFMWA